MEVIRAWISSLSDGSLRDFTLPTEGLVIEVAKAMPICQYANTAPCKHSSEIHYHAL